MLSAIFVERIEKRRKELDLSRDELASRIHIKNRSTIFKYENGERKITLSQVEAFASGLQTTAAYLLGFTDDPNLSQEEIIMQENFDVPVNNK